MRVLILGGTGLISTGIIKHLLARGTDITMFNRAQRPNPWPGRVIQIVGDRNAADFEERFANDRFDVVIDMIGFTPQQAERDVKAFANRCGHFIYCSTVCTYGVKVPPRVLVDETFPQEPISEYGRNKLASEKILANASAAGAFPLTTIRPSHTYGPGGSLVDQLEYDPPTWDRMVKGLPILMADSGMGLWQSTHRDDVGKLFAYAAGNAKTFGQAYNATIETVFTWRDYYSLAGRALGVEPTLVSMRADWIIAQDPKRFAPLAEIFRWHGAYDSGKARRDVPEFRPEIDFLTGAKQTLDDVRRRGTWKSDDARYAEIVTLAQRCAEMRA